MQTNHKAVHQPDDIMGCFRICLILPSFIALCSLNQTATEVYHVTTNSSDHCPVLSCLTLTEFATNLSNYLHPNTTLVFLSGMHYLSNVNLTLSNVENFMMKSENSTAQIKCTSDSHIYFSQSQCVHITNLDFIGCGDNQAKQVAKFLVDNTKFEGQENSGPALELIATSVQIVNSTFVSNRKGSYRQFAAFDVEYVPLFGHVVDGLIGGAIIATNSTIDISHTKFEGNRADFGGAIFADNSTINMIDSVSFINNTASDCGGVLCSNGSVITKINASTFNNNHAEFGGGVLWSFNSAVTIEVSEFRDNTARIGSVLETFNSTITIDACEFTGNSATIIGGVLFSESSIITLEGSVLDNNSATNFGGVLFSESSTTTIDGREFDNNPVPYDGHGGVLRSGNTITIGDCNFTNNRSPEGRGAVIYAQDGTKIQYHNYLLFDNNSANYVVLYLSKSEFRGCKSGHIVFSNNLGSIVGFSSNITFSGYAVFVNNTLDLLQNGAGTYQGGAITLFHSNLIFDGTCNLEHNHAENGGAIHSINSKLYVNGNVTMAHNRATGNGGGIYLSTSELNCQQESNFVLSNNTAMSKGGGLHVISSSITAASDFNKDHRSFHRYIGARVNFTNNAAKFGGGLSLEANAKMYILKYDKNYEDVAITTMFAGNNADYGGAVYVDDDTNFGTCASDPRTECFFQVFALYDAAQPDLLKTHVLQAMYFAQNYAKISGSTLYGGLLDRCAVSQFAEIYGKYFNIILGGISYFKNISVGTTDASISSDPVRVCPCINNVHNCDNKSHNSKVNKHIKKGETFPISFVAVDQVGHPVSAIIRTSLNFSDSGLGEGQLERNISTECTELMFNVVSLHSSEKLILYASDGPCKDAKLSRAIVELHFLPCSCLIGLQVSGATNNTNCTCECHSDISRYMEQCDPHDGLLVKQPQSRAWISYVNDTNRSGYLVYPNCPFDYCLSTSPPVDLNQPNGADAQCAFNRSSLLCGSCQPGLSLSLGSSRCLLCPSYWPALLIAITIAAIFAGIALVTILLVLNMTVAVGTLNGMIFYVNVVYVNKSILLPFQETNFITVFISWLNLDLGIDICYFPGMDSNIKTWLQLAFPAYVFLLVYLVIYISSKSTKFLRKIRKKDPVATLATLIMLSYTKLI